MSQSRVLFRCPRHKDAKIIEVFQTVVREVGLEQCKLYFRMIEGGPSHDLEFAAIGNDPVLGAILAQDSAVAYDLVLKVRIQEGSHGQSDREFLAVRRMPELLDQVSSAWSQNQTVAEEKFIKLVGIAKRELAELQINEAMQGFGNEAFDKYIQAQLATVDRLQSVSADVIKQTQNRLTDLEKEYSQKAAGLDDEYRNRQDRLAKEFEKKEQDLQTKIEAFQKMRSAFEDREPKHLRRQLHKDMLDRLSKLSSKFELTKDTRNLRWPIMGFTVLLILFFGTMTVWSFVQAGSLLLPASDGEVTADWWKILLASIKQLTFTAAFVGTAWFFVKWNDRWFRQHADAEFMFKQLELDINRGSWVVEMVLEWKDEKGREVPAELLASLTRNLFVKQDGESKAVKTPPELASLLLNSAASLKFKTPTGIDVELDRQGMRELERKVAP